MSNPKIQYMENEAQLLRDDVPKSDMEQVRDRWLTEPLSAQEKDRLAKRKQELEDRVSHGMPTHTEMWKPTPENVEKHLNWEKANIQEIYELKKINRRLEPQNPNAGRIEYLRKQGESDQLAKWS